ncbi:MAG: NAD(P)H-hydrate dehydratase, partial [Clostridia bacterium]|nr:NAD(P)H-hydrate dehydratase [Clostridia bacterium]
SIGRIKSQKPEYAANLARELEAICVLKDSVTAVSDGKECYLNQTGNAGMAKAGSGDVLAGTIGALLAQGLPQFDAARLGVYLHGRAGDKAVENRSEHSLLAREIAENINS